MKTGCVVPGGSTARNTRTRDVAGRVACETIDSGLYTDDGWVDVYALLGLKIDKPADVGWVAEWLAGRPDGRTRRCRRRQADRLVAPVTPSRILSSLVCHPGGDRSRGGVIVGVLEEVLNANEEYAASFGAKGELALPPARGFAILTCMDARLDPARYAGLSEGDAHVIRNAGGRASDDAIRSLIISYKLLGTREWFVIHHTNCGMELFTDEVIRGLLANSLQTAALGPDGFYDVGTGPGSAEGKYIDWLTISDNAQSVTEDVTRIRSHPLVPTSIPIYGFIYDVGTGRLVEVPEAKTAGRAT